MKKIIYQICCVIATIYLLASCSGSTKNYTDTIQQRMETDTILTYHNVAIGSDFAQYYKDDQINSNEIEFPYQLGKTLEIESSDGCFFFEVTDAYIDQWGGSGSVDAITIYLRNESEGSLSALIKNTMAHYGVFSYYFFDVFNGEPISDLQKIVPEANGKDVDTILSQAEMNRKTIANMGSGLGDKTYQLVFVWSWKNCEIRISVSPFGTNFNDLNCCFSKSSE